MPNRLLLKWITAGCALLASFVVVIPRTRGQDNQGKSTGNSAVVAPTRIDDAIARVKAGLFNFDDIEVIAGTPESRHAEVIPALEAQFGHGQSSSDKERFATALVRLRDKDDKYWNFLVAQALPALEDKAPFFLRVDENGKTTKEESPQFLKWAADHGLSAEQAMENEFSVYPGAILELGSTGDIRAIPMLRKALLSPNFIVQAEAAQGLAYIQDKNSISLIIDACRKAPADAVSPLLYRLSISTKRLRRPPSIAMFQNNGPTRPAKSDLMDKLQSDHRRCDVSAVEAGLGRNADPISHA